MADNPLIGLPLAGKTLSVVSPDSSQEVQISALNRVIEDINTFERAVKTETVPFTFGTVSDSGSVTLNYTMKTVPHNLGYKPRADLYLNGTNVTFLAGTVVDGVAVGATEQRTIPGIDTPLPTFLTSPAFFIGGMGGGDPEPSPPFYDWLTFFVDAKNLYIIYLPNPVYPVTTLPTDPDFYTVNITYTLSRRAAD